MSLTAEILDFVSRRAIAKQYTYSQMLAHLTEALAVAVVTTSTVCDMSIKELSEDIHHEFDVALAEAIYGPHEHTTH
jgi:hypothetical protein